MGVRGLETFLRNQVPNGVFSINILEEINRRKRERPDEAIVLVFQVVDLLYNIFVKFSTTELLCGPAFKRIHKTFDVNFRILSEYGVDLHFFVNEPSYHKDFEAWSSNESEQYADRVKLLDKIDANIDIETIERLEKEPGATAAMNDLLTICRNYGTVHVCVDMKYIAQVVEHSNETNAMAIIGNNSHFLIFDGNWRYWSCRDIGLMEQSWNTFEFDRNALRCHIGLTRQQMPMFATVVGNEFVGREKLISFHRKMQGSHKFLRLAEYVQLIPNDLTDDERRKFLLDFFGSSNSKCLEMVRNSLLFYTTKTQATGEPDSLLRSAASISATYYNSLKEGPIRIKAPTFYDLRRTDFLPYFDIMLPILRRQIGFVRKHKNDSEYRQVIELRIGHYEPILSKRVTPEYPKAAIPDLMELSFTRTNEYYNGVRFRLLKWMVFGRDTDPEFLVQHIPVGYMVAVMAVMYLRNLNQLSSTEANAILLSIHLIEKSEDYAKGFDFPVIISTRDVLVSHLFIFVHNMVVKCFLFVGLDSFVDYLSIDGVYFVHWVNKLKTGDYEETLSQIEYLTRFLK